MSKLSDSGLQFRLSFEVIRQTLAFLRNQGRLGHEGVLLWAGHLEPDLFRVTDVVIPTQYTSFASFRIPDDEMFRLLGWITERNLVFGVQVHSHPEEAFHSEADDVHCILQHRGAISIVVPDFANIDDKDFFRLVAIYTLRLNYDWIPLDTTTVTHRFLVETP
jgi:hypothetical protein